VRLTTRAAALRQAPGRYETLELELDEPGPEEIRVRMMAAGLCHSDDHAATGDMPTRLFPLVGGHEGAGIVESVGPGVREFAEGDRVVFSFMPACGRCWFCAHDMQNLCDRGADILAGHRPGQPDSFRFSLDGRPVGQLCGLGLFSEYTIAHVHSAIRLPDDVGFDVACLTGCGVGTGWGSAVNCAEVRPGQTVIIMGIGGIGINAVQGAAHAGADTVIAVDPVALKRDAAHRFGATHAFADIEEATEFARSITNGQGADSAIVTIGVVRSAHIGQAFRAIRKGGTVVVTGLGDTESAAGMINLHELTLYQKRIQGALFGGSAPTADIPRQLAMYRQGTLKLDELITRRYTLDQVAEGYEDMHAGRNLRGVVEFDS
jgi:NDMA-dependent alcohol dehydrogenase